MKKIVSLCVCLMLIFTVTDTVRLIAKQRQERMREPETTLGEAPDPGKTEKDAAKAFEHR